MRFIVSRVSLTDITKKPCEEAVWRKMRNIERRTFKTPLEYDEKLGRYFGTWYSKGKNHRINSDGTISRELDKIYMWTVDITSLNALLQFMERYGEVIIEPPQEGEFYHRIRIYDDLFE